MHVLIQVDGGSRGNPGPAAAGVSITDPEGTPLFEAGFHLSPMTNNQAEYHGLLYALREAKRIGATKLDIQADSELLVRQINGQYKVKNEGLRPLYERAVKDLRGFDDWQMAHVRRERNTRADELANLAMDARRDVVEYDFVSAPSTKSASPPRSEPRSTPPRVTIACTAAPNFVVCPAPCTLGWTTDVESTSPAGLCIHAAPDVLRAVHSAIQSGRNQSVACPAAGCGARFGLKLAGASG